VAPTSSRIKGKESGSFSVSEEVLKLAAYKYLQPTFASKSHGSTSGFKYHLEKVRKVVIVNVSYRQELESLWVTVQCSSLRILEDLWDDYCSKHLSGVAQNTLVSKDILEKLGLLNVEIRTTILEEEYKDCRVQFLKYLGEYESLFHLKFTPFSVIHLYQKNIVSIADLGEQGNQHERTIFPVLEGLCCFIVHLGSCFSVSSAKKT